MNAASPDRFYDRLPIFREFTRLMEPALYQPLPDDWVVGVADVVQSTRAIQHNRYKAVNMAGAAVIVAITNALKGRDFPFVFGGDGASFAVAAADAGAARQALAETATWVNEDLDLELRIGLTPITAIRAPWPRRAGRTLCALSEHLDRDVFRRRDRLGRRGDEARRDCGGAGAARCAPGSVRAVVPLRGDPLVARYRAVAGRRARTGRQRL
jgi:hypothetical protein